MTPTYRHKFLEAPSRLILDLATLKDGRYLIEGDIHKPAWQAMCEQAGLPVAGHASARFELTKSPSGVALVGKIYLKAQRQCVRTLETFMDTQVLDVEEHFSLNAMPYQDGLGLAADPVLDLSVLINEQICLGLNPYPVHPATLETPRGGYSVADDYTAQKQAHSAPATDRHRPFAVLSKLKH